MLFNQLEGKRDLKDIHVPLLTRRVYSMKSTRGMNHEHTTLDCAAAIVQ